jgi:RNA-directed DNA polymerase
VWCAQYTPKLKKRTALLRKLKDVFRRHQSQPLDRVIKLINPMLRGWVAYFAVGNSSECFGFVKDWGTCRSAWSLSPAPASCPPR